MSDKLGATLALPMKEEDLRVNDVARPRARAYALCNDAFAAIVCAQFVE